MDQVFQRRNFLKKAAGLTAVAIAPSLLINTFSAESPSEGTMCLDGFPKLNRNYHLYCYKNGSIGLRSRNRKDNKIYHFYEAGLEVEVLLLIAANKSISNNLSELSGRYSLNSNESNVRAEKILKELKSKDLIYFTV